MGPSLSKTPIAARLGTEWHTLSLPIGGIVRFLFFISTAVMGFAALADSHWSVFTHPLSQLTVWVMATDIAKAIVWVALALSWRAWAFSDEKNYPAWALFGVTTLLATIGYAAR